MSLQYPDWATSTATATGSSSASRARTSRSTHRVARSPPMANSTFRWMRRQRMQSRAQLPPTVLRRSEISAGCLTSRPTFLIWASVVSNASPCDRHSNSRGSLADVHQAGCSARPSPLSREQMISISTCRRPDCLLLTRSSVSIGMSKPQRRRALSQCADSFSSSRLPQWPRTEASYCAKPAN